tara:strand:- start:732 stop:1994 length:1263 start_codon:yes stop_codon:yes gene_type:complete
MGSLGGHMNHLWEDLQLTFGDLNEIFHEACMGNLRATEKFDGINLHFRVDANGAPRFSTNKKQRESGGLTQAQFCKLVENHPARKTFVEASEAIFRIAKKTTWPFGFSGRNWVNCDLIDKSHPMTLKYDECAIVLHGVRNFCGESFGCVKESFLKYASECSRHSTVIEDSSWRFLAPVEVNLLDISGEGILSNFQSGLNKIMQASGCNEKSTISDFAKISIRDGVLSEIQISENKKNQLISHIFREEETSLVKIKKGLGKRTASLVSEIGLAKNRNKVIGQAVLPLEILITYTGAKILENFGSVIIDNSLGEIERLKKRIDESISLVESFEDQYFSLRSKTMENYTQKFNQCGKIISALEGIVFEWEESPYKITGNFAPINHILGIPRYGRGKIPPINMSQDSNKDYLWESDLLRLMGKF